MSVYRTIGPLVLIFAPKHRLWVLVRTRLWVLARTASARHVPTIYVLSKKMKNIKNFLLKIFIFYNFKNHHILHGQVFVMSFLFVNIDLAYLLEPPTKAIIMCIYDQCLEKKSIILKLFIVLQI